MYLSNLIMKLNGLFNPRLYNRALVQRENMRQNTWRASGRLRLHHLTAADHLLRGQSCSRPQAERELSALISGPISK